MKLLKTRILRPARGHFFLLGPRGTGKTVWIRQVFPDALRIDLLDPETYRLLAARPERLRELIGANSSDTVVVIDEVQKLPVLLEVAHQLISEGTSHQLVFTGSSARKLRTGNVNLLGGRAVQRTLHPYLACELETDFNLESSLQTGLVPVIVESADRADSLRAYNALYIREEVQAEGLVRNTEQFARFLEAISFSQGSVLNVSNIARDCAVSRKTVEGYIQILEDLLLAYKLPVFMRHAKRQLASHPKFYFYDVGLFRANRPSGPLDDTSSIEGVALESLVAQHLRAWCDYTGSDHQLSYWHTRAGVEVDFVVYGPTEFHAYEVKNSRTVRPEDLKGLRAFLSDYPTAKATLLYRGTDRLIRNGIAIEPVDAWLRQFKPNG